KHQTPSPNPKVASRTPARPSGIIEREGRGEEDRMDWCLRFDVSLVFGVWSSVLPFCAFLVTVALLPGCTPKTDEQSTALHSQIFHAVRLIGTRGVGVGQLNKPRSVAVDAQDNLYVVDMTGRVQKFDPLGAFVLSWQMPQTDLGKPKGMGRDREGNIIVVEPHYQRVNHFTTDGKLVAQWGCRGTNEGCFMLPRGIAENSRGEFLVREYMGAERVQR